MTKKSLPTNHNSEPLRDEDHADKHVNQSDVRMSEEHSEGDPFLQSLTKSLESLQAASPDSPPTIQHFAQLVQTTQANQRARSRRNLLLFMVLALCTGAAWGLGMRFSPRVFFDLILVLSVLSVVGTPIGVLVARGKGASSR